MKVAESISSCKAWPEWHLNLQARTAAMSTKGEQNKGRPVTTPREQRLIDKRCREDAPEPGEMSSAKETTTVRGKDEPQSVRRSAQERRL
jgi:hypothetical protein